jgi:HSP20 family protein
MAVVRWNPWQELNTLQRQFDRMFEEPFASNSVVKFGNIAKVPAAEISETEDAVQLKLEVPGMEAKDLDVQVTETAVYVSGDRKSETKQEENGKTRSEFYYGKFQRVIPLPVRIQNTNVTAEYKDGILHLTLPKTVAEKNKVVKVNLEG